jgi:hypothetical protein
LNWSVICTRLKQSLCSKDPAQHYGLKIGPTGFQTARKSVYAVTSIKSQPLWMTADNAL